MVEHLGDRAGVGVTVSAQTLYNLSQDWYRGRMDEDWEPPTAEGAESIFERHGLTGPFWELT